MNVKNYLLIAVLLMGHTVLAQGVLQELNCQTGKMEEDKAQDTLSFPRFDPHIGAG